MMLACSVHVIRTHALDPSPLSSAFVSIRGRMRIIRGLHTFLPGYVLDTARAHTPLRLSAALHTPLLRGFIFLRTYQAFMPVYSALKWKPAPLRNAVSISCCLSETRSDFTTSLENIHMGTLNAPTTMASWMIIYLLSHIFAAADPMLPMTCGSFKGSRGMPRL